MSDSVTERVRLTQDDHARMQRLSEEIRGRLEEMALIMTRTLGIALTPEMVRRFTPLTAGSLEADVTRMEIVCAPDGATCGCYVTLDDGTGFCEYPCGAAG